MRFLILLILAATCSAEVAVDQPDGWYRWDVSHHGKHAELGAIIGAVGWSGAYLADFGRPGRILTGTGAALAVGVGYEVMHAKGSTYLDPVDAAWTGVGGFASSLLMEAGYSAVTVSTTHNSAALAVAWRF